MADGERIMMMNPNTGRSDKTIAVAIFEPVRDAILAAVSDAGEMRWTDLTDEVVARTAPATWESASVDWYTVTVKLHLEATGLLARHGSPQMLTLTPEGVAAAG